MHYDYNVGCCEFILASCFREREREKLLNDNLFLMYASNTKLIKFRCVCVLHAMV